MPRLAIAIPASSLRARAGVVALVAMVHVLLLWIWLASPAPPQIVLSPMSVSVAIRQAAPSLPQQPEPVKPLAKPQVRHPEPVAKAHQPVKLAEAPVVPAAPAAPVPTPAQPVAAQAVPAALPAAAPVIDTEPDYRANYLNNPRPAYPMVARRMGWQGRVILSVEVLAEGGCGGISVFRSSGHDVLDRAAMDTVKSWRFTPARHGGSPVTRWFKVPVVFSLEDNDA